MAVDENFLKYIEDQLSEFGIIESKKMFGGIGFFRENMMFGMLGQGVFRLKADDNNRKDFEDRNMEQYPSHNGKKGMPYWEVPEDVIEDKIELAKWADKAFQAAVRSKKK